MASLLVKHGRVKCADPKKYEAPLMNFILKRNIYWSLHLKQHRNMALLLIKYLVCFFFKRGKGVKTYCLIRGTYVIKFVFILRFMKSGSLGTVLLLF